MNAVDILVPGISTVTRYARYFSLYWAIAAHAEAARLSEDQCHRLIRRAEVAIASVSRSCDDPDHPFGLAHGVDSLARLDPTPGTEFEVADNTGSRSYSPRRWGFWSQYNGPSVALGTVAVEAGALRHGRHACPRQIGQMYAALIAVAERDRGVHHLSDELRVLSLQHGEETPDLLPLGAVFTATSDGRHDPESWSGGDRSRRATLRILARSWYLHPESETWYDAFAAGVAYGPTARGDRVLAEEERTLAWRGVVLRHLAVGAWRRLWAALVSEVRRGECVSRGQLHEWITGQLPGGSVARFEDDLPPVVDQQGDPLRAEEGAVERYAGTVGDVAVLLLGAHRLITLTGVTRKAFAGRRNYLDPEWVDQVRREFAHRTLAELGRRFVDDMLAQARRVALRKVRMNQDGTVSMFSRLHERNGLYFADSSETRGNIGLRIPQLADLAVQVGLLTEDPAAPVTPRGMAMLDLPE